MKNEFAGTLTFLNHYDFFSTKIEISNTETNEYELLTLEEETDKKLIPLDRDDLDKINSLLYIKDKFGISDECYHELTMTCDSLTRLSNLKKSLTALNKMWDIKTTPNRLGAQQSIRERLVKRVMALEPKVQQQVMAQ